MRILLQTCPGIELLKAEQLAIVSGHVRSAEYIYYARMRRSATLSTMQWAILQKNRDGRFSDCCWTGGAVPVRQGRFPGLSQRHKDQITVGRLSFERDQRSMLSADLLFTTPCKQAPQQHRKSTERGGAQNSGLVFFWSQCRGRCPGRCCDAPAGGGPGATQAGPSAVATSFLLQLRLKAVMVGQWVQGQQGGNGCNS